MLEDHFLVCQKLPALRELESKWMYTALCAADISNGKHCWEDMSLMKSKKSSDVIDMVDRLELFESLREHSLLDSDQSYSYCHIWSDQNGIGNQQDRVQSETDNRDSHLEGDQYESDNREGYTSDSSSLIHQIGRDNSISCLLHCSRSDYGSVASLNTDFRSLVRSGELYRLRRQMGIVEHWVYFSCNLLEWEAFDPIRLRWMHLPRMTSNDCFMWSDKESLAVGTELLVFGKEIFSPVIYKYSILTNSWSSGAMMNEPRCLFGSASRAEAAIVAGGCDPRGSILSSAELYNSDTGVWVTLPRMNKPRKMCSGVFMDGKFYVVGGIGEDNRTVLTCGEVYDLVARTWHEIPNMYPARNVQDEANEMPVTSMAPPLIAVVKNELYAAYYAEKEVRKYNKERNVWVTVGRLPERVVSMNGWGLAFRACGDRLIVVGGPRTLGEGTIEVNSWIPDEGSPNWSLLGSKSSGSFVYNCAVMGC